MEEGNNKTIQKATRNLRESGERLYLDKKYKLARQSFSFMGLKDDRTNISIGKCYIKEKNSEEEASKLDSEEKAKQLDSEEEAYEFY